MTLTGGCAKETPRFSKQASSSAAEDSLEAQLTSFDADPNSFMAAIPEKRDAQGEMIPKEDSTPFTRLPRLPEDWNTEEKQIYLSQRLDYLKEKEYVKSRDEKRAEMTAVDETGTDVPITQEIENRKLPGRSRIQSNDKGKRLFDKPVQFIEKLADMDKLKEASLEDEASPWSDDYWGLYKGSLAARYEDKHFPASTKWSENRDYFEKNKLTVNQLIAIRNSSSLDDLSPAEKYDLIVGDTEKYTFTQYNWNTVNGMVKRNGEVETWMGICHGWAPASYRVARPTKAIKVKLPGSPLTINVYPTDVRALASALWANARVGSNFIGDRCNEKKPKTDKNGRIQDQACFDNNPGSWHFAVVNKIAVQKESFVMDATYDYEVWNQPVLGYSYRYFNPQTGKPAKKFEEARIPLSSFTRDKFKDYRNRRDENTDLPLSESVVGIAMKVTYVVETQPQKERSTSYRADARRTVEYLYDVELDKDGKINGGEWYRNTHPDFLWTPRSDRSARSDYEQLAKGKWEQIDTQSIPEGWAEAARKAGNKGTPLAKLVNTLVAESRIQE